MSDVEIIYNGRIYRKRENSGKWYDPDNNNLTVPAPLQRILETEYAKSINLNALSVNELVKRADILKDGGQFKSALDYYNVAIENSSISQAKGILPRITSCFRNLEMSREAIATFKKAQKKYGQDCLSSALYTSVSAAYCDNHDYNMALVFYRKAYALGNSLELENVAKTIRANTGRQNLMIGVNL